MNRERQASIDIQDDEALRAAEHWYEGQGCPLYIVVCNQGQGLTREQIEAALSSVESTIGRLKRLPNGRFKLGLGEERKQESCTPAQRQFSRGEVDELYCMLSCFTIALADIDGAKLRSGHEAREQHRLNQLMN